MNLRSSYPSSPAQKKEIRDSYEGEARYTDAEVSRLLDALEAHGVFESGTVVLTADHGEEFWDHGGVEHGHSHHGEITDVPLVVVASGLAPGRRPGVASLVDVAPTLRSIAGLATGTGIDLREGVPADRIATAWGGIILRHDCSARDTTSRLLVENCSSALESMRLYDLDADPLERSPSRPTEELAVVRAARAVVAPAKSDAVPLGSDRLRALGYLQ